MVRSPGYGNSAGRKLIGLRSRFPLARLGVATFAVISIALLLVSYFGPVLDHHFTERLPQHAHVYLGDSEPEHAHPFETEHLHNISVDQAAPHGHESPTDNTVYLTPNDESGPNSSDTGFAPAARLMATQPFDPLRSAYLGAERDPTAHSTPPPTRPPRI